MKTYPMPINFDGAKFATRYGLNALAGDFWSDGESLHVPDGLPDDPPIFEAPDPLLPTITSQIETLILPPNLALLKTILFRLAKGA